MKRYLLRRFRGRRPWPRAGTPRMRPALEPLEARNLLDSGLANILVNDPALDTTAQDTQSETAIVLGAGSKVIVAYNDTVDSYAGDSYRTTGYSRSSNGGATFEEESLPLNPHHDLGDPVLARSASTGTIFLSTLGVDHVYDNPNPPPPLVWAGREQVNVFRSTNNGASFQVPANGTPGFVADVDSMDKPWITVDNFPGPGYGNVYLVTRHSVQQPAPVYWNNDILLTRSTDDGLTWGPSGGTEIASSVTQPTIQGANVTVGPDHAVYVFWWDETKGVFNSFNAQLLMRKSTDGGVTFGDPVTVTTLRTPYLNGDLMLMDSSGHRFNTNAFPQPVVNPVTGDIYVAFDDWGDNVGKANWGPDSGKDNGNIYFTESTDGGRKWSKPVQVNDDLTTNDQWFPALAVTPDGSHVGLFWYDRRLDPGNNLIDRFGAIGTVSGHTVTFGSNFRITDESFPPVFTYWTGTGWATQDPVPPPGYMGDYDQAVADNNYFYTTWGDNRLADAFHANQPDVRFAKIPVDWTGMVSPLEALTVPGDLVPALTSAAAAVTEPGAVLSSETSWKGLAVNAYFMDLAGTNQTTSSVTKGDAAPWHSFGLVPPSLTGGTDQVVTPPARLSGALTSALAQRAAHRLADDWATDVLTLADPSWDGEATIWPAG
jgi:hypothetical protein